MKISFYPGCSLEGMANDYAMSVVAVFQALGIDRFQKDLKGGSLPVFYFTERLRLAFDEAAEARCFKQHLTNLVGLLQGKGFL